MRVRACFEQVQAANGVPQPRVWMAAIPEWDQCECGLAALTRTYDNAMSIRDDDRVGIGNLK